MQVLEAIFGTIKSLDSGLVLILVFFIIGLIIRMKPLKALSAGLTFGIALTGVNMVTGYITGSVSGAAAAFAENAGNTNLIALDMGWGAALGIAWQWKLAFLMFPLHIIVNLIMLLLGKTFTLNVDMWNVANKVATGFFVYCVSGSVIVGFAVTAVQAVLELLIGDANRYAVEKISGVPGVTLPHPMFLNMPLFWPLQKLLDKIIPSNKTLDAAALKEKIGFFAETPTIGFILGTLMGLIGKYPVVDSLMVGLKLATGLTLIPLAAKLFMTALTPISDAANEFISKRFPGKELCIGLDWPILAGASEIYISAIISVPFVLLLALVLPFNTVLPLAGILYLCVPITAYLMYEGDLIKMIITNIVTIPFTLYAATYFSPMLHRLALEVGTDLSGLAAGQQLAWYGIDIGFIRWFACEATVGNIVAIAFVILYAVLTFFYLKERKVKEAEIAKELGK